MPRVNGVRRMFQLPTSVGWVRNEVEDEIAFHLEERTAELVARGMDPVAARKEAEREFGDVAEARAELERMGRRRVRHTLRARWWRDLRQDLRYGLRSALRAPLFSLLAIVTLALGIGANAAVFGVVKSVLLDALPYAEAERLVRVYGSFEGAQDRGPLSAGTVNDLAERQRSLASMAALGTSTQEVVFGGDDGARLGTLMWAQPELFPTLGVPVALGRSFQQDDLDPDTARVVVLSHAAWQRFFAGDAGAVGSEVLINRIPRTVLGVLPRDFVGPAGDVDFYMPFDISTWLNNPVSVRRTHWLSIIGRLNPGVSHEAARRELAAIGADLAREYPEDQGSISVVAMPLREAMVGDTRRPLLVLMASAALVLLIACANLAGALLSRTLTRRREFAVRVALGAGRGRLVRQLLTESTLLALIGGAAGLLLAMFGLNLLASFAGGALPDYAELSLDRGAMLVTALLALVTGVAFGVLPALSVARSDPQGTLRDESRGTSESRRSRQLRGVLVAGQIALCISLLAGAGLLARSLWAMASTPLGFDAGGVLAVPVQLPNRDYGTWEARLQFYEAFQERLGGLPGVDGVAVASQPPTTIGSRNSFTIEGLPWPEGAEPWALYASVSDDYFRTLRIPLRQGRTFDARDHNDAPPTVIISESMARRFWPNGDAVGSRIRMGPDLESPLIEIIGVVGDVRNDPTQAEAEATTYRSYRQDTWNSTSFLVRTRGDPLALVRPAELELRALDPGLPVAPAQTLDAIAGEGLAGRRLPVMLMSAFGALALLLASVGVYAMFASMAAAREREFGVRMALGSSRAAIAALVLRQGGVWMAVGLAGGALGIVLVVGLLRDLLYGVAAFDPLTLGVAVATLLACAALALLAPVRRATRVDPATAMRAQ